MIEYITALICFPLTIFIVWIAIEKLNLVPAWLDYKPFSCRKCCTFWCLVAEAVGFGIAQWWIACIAIALLACLNAYAMLVDERENGFRL